jgi:Tol biopolymer transport system component
LSPDGRRIVTGLRSGSIGASQNLWQIDADQGAVARITVGQATDIDPRWSPDGTTVIFGSTRDTSRSPFRAGVAADTPALVWKYDGRMFSADDWSRDGKWLLFHDAGGRVLMARPIYASGTPAGEPVAAARTLSGIVDQAQMSPDGTWIAYNASESGRYEVYVTPFPPTGERYSVSRAGGLQPTWRADGGELYYLTAEGALNAVKVLVSGGKFDTSDPVELVRPRLASVSPSLEQYAPHPSGTKFLFLETAGDENNLSLGVLLNWPSLVPRGQ